MSDVALLSPEPEIIVDEQPAPPKKPALVLTPEPPAESDFVLTADKDLIPAIKAVEQVLRNSELRVEQRNTSAARTFRALTAQRGRVAKERQRIEAAIVEYRSREGPFQSVDDLLGVPGIGPAKLDALRGSVAP